MQPTNLDGIPARNDAVVFAHTRHYIDTLLYEPKLSLNV